MRAARRRLWWGVVLLPGLATAAELTLAPASVDADYTGPLTYEVTGLTPGQSMTVETTLDVDADGVPDPGEPLVQSFPLTDGILPRIGGARLLGVPGDEDATSDGRVTAVVRYEWMTELAHGAGRYLVRVSPVGGGFSPLQQAFRITTSSRPQGVEGTVTSGGTPVPHALVGVVDESSGRYYFRGVVADAAGQYRVPTRSGDFQVIAIAAGHVHDFSVTASVTDGVFVQRDLVMTPADRVISGRLVEAGTTTGIPGVQVSAGTEDEAGTFTATVTRADGGFTVPVIAGSAWRLEPDGASAMLGGWLYVSDLPRVDASAGDVEGLEYSWTRGTAVIHGRTTDGSAGLVGMIVYTSDDVLTGRCISDDAAQYACVAGPGAWRVQADDDQAAALGYVAPSAGASLTAGESQRHDLVYWTTSSKVRGQVVLAGSGPVPRALVFACAPQPGPPQCSTALADGEGRYELGVSAGTWNVRVSEDTVSALGGLGPEARLEIADGQEIDDVTLVILVPTNTILANVEAGAMAPVPGIRVHATARIEPLNYYTHGVTGPDGNATLPVVETSWTAWPECADVGALGYACPGARGVEVLTGSPGSVSWLLAPLPCTGDCDDDGGVEPGEIDAMVPIVLQAAPVASCPKADETGDGRVTAHEVVRALIRMRDGCRPG